MVTDDVVLNFFRDALPELGTLTFKRIPLQIDDILQDYADFDDLSYAINQYAKKFGIDVSVIDFNAYYPWNIAWFFRSWFTKEPIEQISKPLTVRMFAESAKAGYWLYE